MIFIYGSDPKDQILCTILKYGQAKMNSLVTGAEEKSGLRRIQLQHVSDGPTPDAAHRLQEVGQTNSSFLQKTRAELIF